MKGFRTEENCSMSVTSVNPATGHLIARYEFHTEREIERRLERSAHAFGAWSTKDFAERANHLRSAAAGLREQLSSLAELIAVEMGKPLAEGKAEVEKCAWVCEHYADNARSFLEPVTIGTDAQMSRVVYRPLGPVLALMPWNFPFWQLFRFAAPTLMAGNVAVLRHASNVTGCALAIEKLFQESGLPLSLVITNKDQVPRLIDDSRIKAVTLTGSAGAGRAVASAAGRAIKKTVLELGGSDPYLILRDADLELAVERCVTSRLINSGQSCIAAKRFIVEAPLHDRFAEAFVESMRAKRAADPFEPDADIGPLAQAKNRDRLHEQVRRSIEAGAVCALGGEVPVGEGYFYPPTVLTHVKPDMAAFDQEVFGPVAAITAADDAEAAVRLANQTCYGLGAAIFTRDVERAETIAAQRLDAGSCFINDFVRSDPRLPFGGIKQSGYGRELGAFGIKEFVNVKTVYVANAWELRR
jgi:succinate-semialdehyde dehydrogenase/glutarate-semialdehyde dehydrogenase